MHPEKKSEKRRMAQDYQEKAIKNRTPKTKNDLTFEKNHGRIRFVERLRK